MEDLAVGGRVDLRVFAKSRRVELEKELEGERATKAERRQCEW